jgi:hypothetical protein
LSILLRTPTLARWNAFIARRAEAWTAVDHEFLEFIGCLLRRRAVRANQIGSKKGGILMICKLKSGVVGVVVAMGLVVLGTGVVTAQDIKTNYMPGTDFSKYHTYKWVAINNTEQVDPIVTQQIRDAVDAQLTGKGMTKTDAETADMYVGIQTSIQQQQQWNAYGTGGGWRFGGGMASATSSTIQIGTLVVDFYDPATKQLVWRGVATKTLNPSKNAQTNLNRINQGVAKLLKTFPPKA